MISGIIFTIAAAWVLLAISAIKYLDDFGDNDF
jgi:hypothetical protein